MVCFLRNLHVCFSVLIHAFKRLFFLAVIPWLCIKAWIVCAYCNSSYENKQTQTIQKLSRKKLLLVIAIQVFVTRQFVSHQTGQSSQLMTLLRNQSDWQVHEKDMGLEELDSLIASKAVEMRHEKVEQSRARSNRRQRKSIVQPSLQFPPSHS